MNIHAIPMLLAKAMIYCSHKSNSHSHSHSHTYTPTMYEIELTFTQSKNLYRIKLVFHIVFLVYYLAISFSVAALTFLAFLFTFDMAYIYINYVYVCVCVWESVWDIIHNSRTITCNSWIQNYKMKMIWTKRKNWLWATSNANMYYSTNWFILAHLLSRFYTHTNTNTYEMRIWPKYANENRRLLSPSVLMIAQCNACKNFSPKIQINFQFNELNVFFFTSPDIFTFVDTFSLVFNLFLSHF